MAKVYIYSTLSASVAYTVYRKSTGNDLPQAQDRIVIEGGAGVINKNLVTPRGVVTVIDEEKLALLQEVRLFRKHVENGFIKIAKSEADPDKVAVDMEQRDKSDQMVGEDFEENKAPKATGGKKKPAGKKASSKK